MCTLRKVNGNILADDRRERGEEGGQNGNTRNKINVSTYACRTVRLFSFFPSAYDSPVMSDC